MKALQTIIIMCAMSFTLFAQTSTPLRCKSNTRWGQCTNEAFTSDTLCTIHRQQSQPLPVASQTEPTRTITPTTKATTTKSTSRTVRSSLTQTPSKRAATSISSGRCQARTKKGSQCSRSASSGSRYCWQHSR